MTFQVPLFRALVLTTAIVTTAQVSSAQNRQKRMGEPFLSVFPVVGLNEDWWVAEYDHPADLFQTGWRKEGTVVGRDGVMLQLKPTDSENIVSREEMDADDGTLLMAGKTFKPYVSGQMQRRGWFGYGRYEVVMRAGAGYGMISSFYVYTGPHFGHTHEEIDFEFLGRDTEKVFLNRFVEGEPFEDLVWADLGFDAAKEAHLYAFEWTPDAIVWYVDGKEIHRADGAENVPQPPAKIYFDLWAGGPRQANWSGAVSEEQQESDALYQCVSYAELGADTPQCSDLAGWNVSVR